MAIRKCEEVAINGNHEAFRCGNNKTFRSGNDKALRNDNPRAEAILERIPAGRWGDPKDFEGPIVFLC